MDRTVPGMPADGAVVVHANRPDAPAREMGQQAATDGFDFGKFRHGRDQALLREASGVSGRDRPAAPSCRPV